MTASVLIVVPVYGDVDSLVRCVDALRSHVDTRQHRVLLVNDCGPDADDIEKQLLARIEGVPGFRYERNERNLGFVGTCNRAVTELDTGGDAVLLLNSDAEPTAGFLEAMTEALFADDRTGVVTARSDNATIASIPYRLTDRRAARTPERTRAVWTELVPYLPASQEVPVAMGFCFMTRRELIARYGLFDEAFAPGYGEENDFCLRIAADGWTSRIANRALVFHEGSKSFAGDRRLLREAHQRELERRYPFLPDAVTAYQRLGVSAAERFADVLVPSGARLRVALDCRTAADPDALATVARAAFDEARFSIEIAHPGTAATHPDDLVTVAILVDPTVSEILEANRRALLIGVVSTDGGGGRWADRGRRSGSDLLPLDAYAVGTSSAEDLRPLARAIDAALSAPLSARVDSVGARWAALRLADAAAFAAGTDTADGDEVRRLRSELADIRASRAYRTARRLSSLARRVPGRRPR